MQETTATEANSTNKQQYCNCSNSRIATQRAAATEIHDRYVPLHTRTSYSGVKHNQNISGPGTLL